MIRVLIAAGVRFYREGLAEALPGACDAVVVETVSDSAELRRSLRRSEPDVILLDSRLAEGLETSRVIRSAFPEVRIVVLALAGSTDEVIAWAEGGASAYVSSDASVEELATVIQDTMDGRLHCPPAVAAGMMERLHALSTGGRGGGTDNPVSKLTEREREVLELVERGLSNKRIARILGISVSTAKNHIHSILKKLDVDRRGEAAAVVRGWRAP